MSVQAHAASGTLIAAVRRAVCCALVLALSGCSDEAPVTGARPALQSRAVPVVAEPIQLEPMRTRIEAVGTAVARRSVSLFAESAGEVVTVNFQPGDRVGKDTVLLALDARDQQLDLELATVRLAEAERALRRLESANDNVSRMVPESEVDTARTVLETARIDRDRARIALERRFVTAPFDGYVGITDVEPGDRIDASTEITTIDDRAALLVSFDVPEAFVDRLQPGDPLQIETWSAGAPQARGQVVEIGSRVDPLSRAFTVRAEVPNPDDRLRPGMSFRVRLDLLGERYPVVPEVALQWGANGAYVWVAEQGERARRVPVQLVQRLPGRVLVEGELPAGTLVVGEGVQSMREGVALRNMDAAALARDARAVLTQPAREG